jgi:putative hydrolase of the HAD superfamily
MIDIDYVVWDFDGVINRNFVDGRFVWSDNIEVDLGVQLFPFNDYVFGNTFLDVICGRKDLLEHIGDWITHSGFQGSAQGILDYWFEKDALPDPHILSMIDEVARSGLKNVIATNNENRRAAYIEDQMGFKDRVEAVLSSGRMGCMKPQKVFFDHVTEYLGIPCHRLLLVDDLAKNVDAAAALGWRSHQFEFGKYDPLRNALGLARGE